MKYVKKDTLHVKLKSSVVRNELTYSKNKILEEINSKAGKTVLQDIYLK